MTAWRMNYGSRGSEKGHIMIHGIVVGGGESITGQTIRFRELLFVVLEFGSRLVFVLP